METGYLGILAHSEDMLTNLEQALLQGLICSCP